MAKTLHEYYLKRHTLLEQGITCILCMTQTVQEFLHVVHFYVINGKYIIQGFMFRRDIPKLKIYLREK